MSVCLLGCYKNEDNLGEDGQKTTLFYDYDNNFDGNYCANM